MDYRKFALCLAAISKTRVRRKSLVGRKNVAPSAAAEGRVKVEGGALADNTYSSSAHIFTPMLHQEAQSFSTPSLIVQ